MAIKKIMGMQLLALSLCSVSVLAQAGGLTIVNNTDMDSTSIINDGMCSNTLSGGVSKAHSTNIVSSTVIGLACFGHSSDCKADVYMTNNCSGDKVGTVIFDTKNGIKSVTMNTNQYQITGSGFNIQLDGGSTIASR